MRTAILTWAVLAAVLVAPLQGSEAVASSADPRPSPLAQGQILDIEGQPADAVRVDVVALRDRGDVQVPQVVATAITNEDGRWVADRPARAVKVDQMEIRAIVDGRHLVYNFVADDAAPSSGSQQTTTSSQTFDVTLRAGKGATEGADMLGAEETLAVKGADGTTAVEVPETRQQTESQVGVHDRVRTDAATAPCAYGWFPQNKYRKRWAPLKVSRTRSKSTQVYVWSTTRHTDLEVAINDDGDTYAGGLSNSVNEQSGMTIKPRWPNNTSKLVRAQWEYRRYRAWCFGGPPPSDPPQPLNLWKWRPNEALGYTKSEPNAPTFACRTRGPVHAKIRLKQRATVRWGGWFSIIGVELDNTQTQTEHTALVIKPDTEQTPRYCGSGQYLRTSAFVRERP